MLFQILKSLNKNSNAQDLTHTRLKKIREPLFTNNFTLAINFMLAMKITMQKLCSNITDYNEYLIGGKTAMALP